MHRLPRLPSLLVVAMALAACGDEGPVSAPGTVTATVLSGNPTDGSAVLDVFGDGIGEVGAVDGWLFSERRGDTVRVVVVNDEPGLLRFTVALADTTVKPQAVFLQVAGPDDELRASMANYRLELGR